MNHQDLPSEVLGITRNNSNSNKLLKSTLKILSTKPFSELIEPDLKIIYELYNSLSYFKSLGQIPKETYWKITCAMKFMTYNKGEIVFNCGDKGKHFYIVLRGKVSYQMPKNKYSEDENPFEEIFKFDEGKAFGQFSLCFKTDREATVECLENSTILGMLLRDDYQILLEPLEKNLINATCNFLKNITFFNEFSILEIEKLHFFLERRNFEKGDLIYKINDDTDGIYCIKKGLVTVSKYLMNNVNFLLKSEGARQIELTNYKSHDIVGDIEVIGRKQVRDIEAKCSENTETLYCHRIPFYYVSTPYSIKKKMDHNDKKMDKLNNLMRVKLVSISTHTKSNPLMTSRRESVLKTIAGKKENTVKLHINERDMPSMEDIKAQGAYLTSGKRLGESSYNFFGFAGDARKYGNEEFEKSLEHFSPKMHKFRLSKIGDGDALQTKLKYYTHDDKQMVHTQRLAAQASFLTPTNGKPSFVGEKLKFKGRINLSHNHHMK